MLYASYQYELFSIECLQLTYSDNKTNMTIISKKALIDQFCRSFVQFKVMFRIVLRFHTKIKEKYSLMTNILQS